MAVTESEFKAQLDIFKNGRGVEVDIAAAKMYEMLYELATAEEETVEENTSNSPTT